MKNKNFPHMILFLFLFLTASMGQASGTVIRNGGDPLFEFLTATRSSLVETAKLYLSDPDEKKSFCTRNTLPIEKQSYCQKFFADIVYEMLRMNQGNQATAFVLRKEPLEVIGPDGKPMIVSARTELGSAGPVEFHRDSVKTLAPTQLLFLIMHEFGHKVAFENRFMTDDEQPGPFSTGRELLDTVATALTTLAKKRGLIGNQFGIRDIFECQAQVGQTPFGARISSSRMFLSEDLRSYQTSFGKNPLDGSIFFPETINSSLFLRMQVNEPNNCEMGSPLRKTILEVVRQVRSNQGNTETVLAVQEYPISPICPNSDQVLSVMTESVRFDCRYYGAEGTTSSIYSLKGL